MENKVDKVDLMFGVVIGLPIGFAIGILVAMALSGITLV